MTTAPVPWQVTARNLPEHAGNTIHTDEGARAAGFSAALVAGVTTYVYLSHPVIAAWGSEWVRGGGAEIRFRAPVVHGDVLTCTPVMDGDTAVVTVTTPRADAGLAVLRAEIRPEPLELRNGELLPVYEHVLSNEFGAGYPRRTGDDLDLFEREGIIHPAVWTALANRVYTLHLVRGPWIHTRSVVRHHAIARDGATARVHAHVVDRFERSGSRAVTHMTIEADGELVATLEHEAIVQLAPSNK